MDVVDLLKFINSDLTWKTVKKGHRTRRPRRPGASDKLQDAVASDYEKSGVAILGQHFADAVIDVPIKKRILLLESPSLSVEHARSPPLEDSEMLVSSKHSLGVNVKPNEKKLPVLNDFSGIALLADAACHGPVESMEVEVLTTPPIVVSNTDGIKDDTTPMESEDLPFQDSKVPVTPSICDNGNDTGDTTKAVRFHWDLNAAPPMDEWVEEEPSCDIKTDGFPNVKPSLETINSQVMEVEKGSTDHDATIKCKISDAESCEITNSDVVDSFIHPTKCENVSTSTDSVLQQQTTVRVEPIIKSDEGQSVSEVLQGGCLSLKLYEDKPTSEDRLSDFCGSNASEDEHADGNTIEKVKPGYDSPVEDGELREREQDRFPWENEEVEERECVDYESDNIYGDSFDSSMEISENETSLDQHQNIGPVADSVNHIEHDDRMNNLEDQSQSAIIEDKDGKFISERKLSLDRSTSTSFGVRKTGFSGAYIRRSRSDNIGNTYARDAREFGPEKFMARDGPSYQRRTPNGQWGDSFSRNNHGYPKNVMRFGTNGVENKEHVSYNPRMNHRTFNRGPPPPPARSISRDGLRRAPPQYTERKISSFSSNFNQSGRISRKRSRSRSRSRSGSPIAWNFQKKGNPDAKEQSPDYRPDTRLPLRKPGEIESRPQCVSRSFDNRNIMNRQYRSPVRTFHRDQRFEAKSNDHFRPTPRPGRFPANSDDKYGMMNRGRPFRNDTDDYIKDRNKVNGFRYTRNEDRSFRDPVRRDIPKNTYTTNKMFNTGKGDFYKDD